MKLEYRNSKSETISKSECSKFETLAPTQLVLMFWSLKFKRFEFVSSFDIRISDLKVNLME